MSTSQCPAETELSAFASGLLPLAEFERVARHVEECADCQRRLAGQDGRGDAVFAALRSPPDADPAGQPTLPPLPRPTAPTAPGRPLFGVGSRPKLESEIRVLLQFRLRVLSAVAMAAYVFFCLLNVVGPLCNALKQNEWTWYNQGLLILVAVIQAPVTAILWSRPRLSLTRLRALELVTLGACAAYYAGARFATLAHAGEGLAADSESALLAAQHATLLSNMHWFFVLAFYGLLVPNTLRRCVAVVGGAALVPLAVTAVAGAVNPVVAARLPLLLVVTTMGLGLTTALAAFGSFKISTLQREAFVARQEARELGQYRLTRKLGGGGMGDVYLAEHRLLKRPCAVKLIHPQRAGDPDHLRRFEREVQATAQLRHPHTVEIYDYGHADDGTFYYVMEYLPGMTLDEVVKRQGPLPPARAVHLLRQLCSALRAAHGVGLIHRDIKPGNVMLCPDGTPHDRVKLLDFGLVRPIGTVENASKLTQEGVAVGTPDYMSPEQIEGVATIDGRCDLYSVGGLAYFLLAGRPPFVGDSALRILLAHLETPVSPLREFRPDVPDDLASVVHRCLAKAPAERFADAAALDRALAGCDGRWTEDQAAEWWKASGGPLAA